MCPGILFVEDDKDDEEMIREILERQKYSDFCFCPDGTAALDHFKTLSNNELPSLVVSDLYLPLLGGLELTKIIAANERLAGIWVVVYSGSLTPDIKTTLQEAGVREIFQKPNNLAEFEGIIIRIIEMAALHDKELR